MDGALAFITVAVLILVLLVLFGSADKQLNQVVLPPPSPPKSAQETLAELKAQEKLEKNYRLEFYWSWMGKRIDNPTIEQMSDARLVRVERWVKK